MMAPSVLKRKCGCSCIFSALSCAVASCCASSDACTLSSNASRSRILAFFCDRYTAWSAITAQYRMTPP